jgi:rod shape-determining protein MreB
MSRLGFRSRDLGVDLGTSNTRIHVYGRGVVVSEPSVVAVRTEGGDRGRVVAVGAAANQMLGRAPRGLEVVRPLRSGVIADVDCAEILLRQLLPPVSPWLSPFRPRMVLAVPSDLTNVEKRAVYETALHAGASEVLLVAGVMAAAIGAGLPVDRPSGNLVLDVGGGTTEVAVISVTGVVCSTSLRVGGEAMNDALIDFLKRKYNLLIGDHSAELLKLQLGTAYPTDDMASLPVRGRDLISGVPKEVELHSEEAREALTEPVAAIVEGVRTTLECTPPELSADIAERGIVMVGGGSLLANLDLLLREATGLPVVRSEDPHGAVAIGTGRIVEDPAAYRDLTDAL